VSWGGLSSWSVGLPCNKPQRSHVTYGSGATSIGGGSRPTLITTRIDPGAAFRIEPSAGPSGNLRASHGRARRARRSPCDHDGKNRGGGPLHRASPVALGAVDDCRATSSRTRTSWARVTRARASSAARRARSQAGGGRTPGAGASGGGRAHVTLAGAFSGREAALYACLMRCFAAVGARRTRALTTFATAGSAAGGNSARISVSPVW